MAAQRDIQKCPNACIRCKSRKVRCTLSTLHLASSVARADRVIGSGEAQCKNCIVRTTWSHCRHLIKLICAGPEPWQGLCILTITAQNAQRHARKQRHVGGSTRSSRGSLKSIRHEASSCRSGSHWEPISGSMDYGPQRTVKPPHNDNSTSAIC